MYCSLNETRSIKKEYKLLLTHYKTTGVENKQIEATLRGIKRVLISKELTVADCIKIRTIIYKLDLILIDQLVDSLTN